MPRSSAGRGSVSWRQRWAEKVLPLPPSSGFREMYGTAEYVRASRSLMLTVALRKPRPENAGPAAVQHRRVIRWPPGRNIPKARAALDHEMRVMRTQLDKRTWPETRLYIQECNAAGADLEDFMDTVCSECTFPTCTLRD